MNVTELANEIGRYSVLMMWAALAIRARPAWQGHYQRGLWLAIFNATIATTLFQPEVIRWAVHVTGDHHTVTLSRNLIGVLSAGLTLLFIVDSTRGRRLHVITAVGLVVALATLIAMDLTRGPYPGPAIPSTDGPAAPSASYWLIVCGAHLVTDVVAVIVCWRYSWRTDDRDLMWSLRLFAIGSVLAIGHWATYLVDVYVRIPDALPYIAIVINIHGFSRALSLLVPTATRAVRLARNVRTVWVLWPMWHDLSTAVPNVVLVPPRSTRVREMFRRRMPLALQAHRQTIETYDAILDLQPHVRTQAYEQAREHAQRARIPAPRATAAALAAVLGQACRAKLAGETATTPNPLPGLERGDAALLLAIARSWSSMSGALPATEPSATVGNGGADADEDEDTVTP